MRHYVLVRPAVFAGLLSIVYVGAAPGCLTAPPPARRDAGLPDDSGGTPPLTLDWVGVTDLAGVAWPLTATPRRPVIKLRWSEPPAVEMGEAPPVWLLTGAPDQDLLDDLDRAPLRVANRARAVPATLVQIGPQWTLTADQPLPPDAALTLAVGSWLASRESGERVGVGVMRELHVSPAPEGGAQVVASWPPDGAAAVAPSLPELAIRCLGPIGPIPPGSITLREGEHVEDADVEVVPCDQVGWQGGRCIRLLPQRPLRRGSAHSMVIDERFLDATGAPLGPWTSHFTTALEAPPAPEPRTISCAIDELETPVGCALADDSSLTLRVDLGEPVRITWTLGSRTVLSVAPRGLASLSVPDLEPGAALVGALVAEDTSGRETRWAVELSTLPPLAELAVVEVRSDPLGPEPTQEYVEVLNFGAVTLDLEGFQLSDRDDVVGDLLRGILAPGERALIVSERFDPDNDADPRVPPGVRLVRVDRALGSGGLSNAGEPVFLRDAEGHRLSAAPATSTGGGGICLVRTGDRMRTADGFTRAPCTPGVSP